jgi:hypothetical protein
MKVKVDMDRVKGIKRVLAELIEGGMYRLHLYATPDRWAQWCYASPPLVPTRQISLEICRSVQDYLHYGGE